VEARRVTLLDGGLGTELAVRGVATPAPLWSAAALESAPDVVRAIHADYAAAGALVHTTATFRARRRSAGARWRTLVHRAVELAREGAQPGQRVAGSIAPLADCYRPELAPDDAFAEHAELANALAEEGVDLLLCETFANGREALSAVEAAVATGLPTWLALTAGPFGELLTAKALGDVAREAAQRGASAVLVCCVGARITAPYVRALADAGVPFGAYANAGAPEDGVGWSNAPHAAEAYARLALEWIAEGATLVGGCCGTGPAHIRALAARLGY
jgi:S-methylmethionine-dependent homocysteine/selenocysteine methylase